MISYKKFQGYNGALYRSGFSVLQNMSLLQKVIIECAWSPIVWKNNYAKTDNFISSDFLALDFDEPGEETLNEINNALSDHKRIIATTKSHQKDKNGVTCDRFRLIIPFAERITDYRTYRATYQKALVRFPWADKSCLDGARFFFPSKELLIFDRESEYKWDIIDPAIAFLDASEPTVFTPGPVNGKIPLWCLRFINDGEVHCNSRNLKVFSVARELFRQGFSESDTRRLILKAPIKWDGVNVEAILKSAKNKELK